MPTELATVSQLRNPVNGSSSLRDVRHGVGAAHDGQVDAERNLRGRMPQPLGDHLVLQRRLFDLTGNHLSEGQAAKLSTALQDALK